METLAARWRASSLRTQLMALTGMLLAVSIVVTSFVAISVLRDSLINSIDDSLQGSLHSVSTALMSEMSGSPTETVPHQGYLLSEDGQVVTHVDATGRTATDAGSAPDLSKFTREMAEQSAQVGMTVSSADGAEGSWRVVAAPQARTSYTVVVAEPLGDTNGLVSAITLLTLSFGAATLIAALVVGWVLITRAFQPLKKVEQTAAKIAEGDLSRRMVGYNSETEVGQLSMSLNRMLGHIEDAFDARKNSEAKLRQFVADASHELRTPLVSIRGYSELYRHGALRDEEQVGQAMGRIEAESTRMTQLVEDLLSLARLDSKRELSTSDVDLLVLAHDAAADFAASSPDRKITVTDLDDAPATPVWTCGDEAKLRQVVANLMTNAVRYTPKGSDLQILIGTVPVAGVPQDQRPAAPQSGPAPEHLAQIKVRDHGPGIKGADRDKVFERFYRADTSRTRETGGTGLGLSIVSAVIDQHGGTVTLEDTPGGGATFVVSLPRVSTPEPPPETPDDLPVVTAPPAVPETSGASGQETSATPWQQSQATPSQPTTAARGIRQFAPEPDLDAGPPTEDNLPPIPEIDDDDPDIIDDTTSSPRA
ncbi:sensor histidine kinase [Kocuria sp.]|uniref:sensor histidine kinase n=1 Tax=Kocuria sp. TaxID=1871328 RepID=UPI0034CD1741